MTATTIRRIVFAVGLVILGGVVGRFSANYEIQSRHTTEDFSRFIARVDNGDVGEVTFVAAGELNYVTRSRQTFETNVPPGTAEWLTKSLLDRGVKVKATAAAAR
jgi:hypothetical protein